MATRDRSTADDTTTGDGADDNTTSTDAATAAGVTSADSATLTDVQDETPDSVASYDENAALEHSEGGTTTRQDATDVGVPMLPGSPNEPVGPEDALGPGPTRGDYRDRIGPAGYNPTQTVRIPDAKPGEPHTRVVAQRPNADNIGDVEGKKGGVETTADDTPGG